MLLFFFFFYAFTHFVTSLWPNFWNQNMRNQSQMTELFGLIWWDTLCSVDWSSWNTQIITFTMQHINLNLLRYRLFPLSSVLRAAAQWCWCDETTTCNLQLFLIHSMHELGCLLVTWKQKPAVWDMMLSINYSFQNFFFFFCKYWLSLALKWSLVESACQGVCTRVNKSSNLLSWWRFLTARYFDLIKHLHFCESPWSFFNI